jgi:hypothetical protein
MIHTFRQAYTVSLVFIGNFNPSIFQPYWFAHKQLIREKEAQEAKVELIHQDLVKWEINWMYFEVSKNRLEIRTTQEPYFEPIRDLAVSIFDLMREIPIQGFGINHLLYFALPDETRYFEFGNKLAPLSKWNGFLKNPKLFQLEIGEEKRDDGFKGQHRIRILPSNIEMPTPYGLLIHVHDHFDISSDFEEKNKEIIAILREQWSISIKRAVSECEKIWDIK